MNIQERRERITSARQLVQALQEGIQHERRRIKKQIAEENRKNGNATDGKAPLRRRYAGRIAGDNNEYMVELWTNGTYTVALLRKRDGDWIESIGVTKRCPLDRNNYAVAEQVAVNRALEGVKC